MRVDTRQRRAGRAAAFLLMACMLSVNGQTMYWTEMDFANPGIASARIDGSDFAVDTLPGGTLPVGIAVDGYEGTVYWSELAYADAAVSSSPDSAYTPAPLLTGGSAYRGIALVPSLGKIYWTATNQTTGARILRTDMSGGSPEDVQLFPADARFAPFDIAFHTPLNAIYWTDFAAGKIMAGGSAPLAGIGTVQDSLNGPTGIALDTVTDMIYWTEGPGGTVSRIPRGGGAVDTVVSGRDWPHYLALDLYSGYIYWTEIGTPQIVRSTLDGDSVTVLPVPARHPGGIALTHDPAVRTVPVAATLPSQLALSVVSHSRSPQAVVQYQVPERADVTVRLWNVQARMVKILASGRHAAGTYRAVLGKELAAGTYVVRMRSGAFRASETLRVVR